jgi:branched-chain amino acid transport system ATP-binding protein
VSEQPPATPPPEPAATPESGARPAAIPEPAASPTAPKDAGGNGVILEVTDIHVYYGAIHALKGISIDVREGEIVTLIGANGAGKSTTLRSINGLNRPRTGRIVFRGKDITSSPAHTIVKLGISQSPEGRKLFPRMSVLENLEMGTFQMEDRSTFKEDLERVYTLFPRLAERKTQKAGTLSGGEQQMVAMGRALMAHPKLLMLDEPSMGLAPIFVERIFEIVIEINKQGTPILLVEQNALMALDVANRGYVMETGHIALTDEADALSKNEQVQKAYLGID